MLLFMNIYIKDGNDPLISVVLVSSDSQLKLILLLQHHQTDPANIEGIT